MLHLSHLGSSSVAFEYEKAKETLVEKYSSLQVFIETPWDIRSRGVQSTHGRHANGLPNGNNLTGMLKARQSERHPT